ncbi:MAG: hypothetical protein HYV13_04015 [Candidatus Doudnabacteria bacterium]|nr:hypothetical protein [Candidatus Doudnabacteria bacterium]
MIYWPAEEYNPFEAEITGHPKKNDGWFERYCVRELKKSEKLYNRGFELKKTDWQSKTNRHMAGVLKDLLEQYRELACPWYAQYPLDEYFEKAIEEKLLDCIKGDNPNFRHYVLVFTDPKEMTDVAEERWKLTLLAKELFKAKADLNSLPSKFKQKIQKHLDKFAYINRGLATSKPYSYKDIIDRLKEIKRQISAGQSIDDLIYFASEKKVGDDYKDAIEKIRPKKDFQKIIGQAKLHSYVRNRRVEAFFNADYGASFMYAEIARRAKFNPDWIMEVSTPEMFGALRGKPLPNSAEMQRRFKDYAMVVRNAETKLITDPAEIKKLEKKYFVKVEQIEEIHGRMACLGGMIRGRARVCLDKHEIGKVKRGDILVAQFTTPDFVPAMEKAVAIVADQGGLSSHAAIVSRELGVPCVIATQNGTRIIHDDDLLEVDAQKGIVRILERAK